jgi:serine/threonine protein kinase
MIYEMVAGRLPFERTEGGHLSLMRMHAIEQPPELTKIAPDAPLKLETAVMRAMRKDPVERPTAAELGTMLRELLQDIRVSGRARRTSDAQRA